MRPVVHGFQLDRTAGEDIVRDGEPVARGSGDRDRRVRCERAAARSVESAPVATPDAVVPAPRRRGTTGRAEAVG